MNPDTVHLIQRNFGEVSNDILTSLVGGVVNEPIIFDLKSDLYPLARTASGVRSITGQQAQANGAQQPTNYTFEQGIDYAYNPDLASVQWLEAGVKPEDGSIFFVDYLPSDASSPITDINVGGVARTVSEAVAREIATVYEQVNRAYRFGFVDTAEGKALDLVVSILGISRKSGDFATGLVTFFRDPGVTGDVTIAASTKLSAKKGAVEFETTQQRTLQRGQARIDVPVRASAGFGGEDGRVDAGAIDIQLKPLAGIEHITNAEPTILGAAEETDAELRLRAKAELFKLGNATLPALDAAVRDSFSDLTGFMDPNLVQVWDPNGPVAQRTPPGVVTLLVNADPKRFSSLHAAVNNQRAAGIAATIVARYVFVTPRIVAQIKPGLTPDGRKKLINEIVAAISTSIRDLGSGAPLQGGTLIDDIKEVEDVTEATIVDLHVFRIDASPSKPATVTEALLNFLDNDPPNEATALRAELNSLLFGLNVEAPTDNRIPDRSLIVNADGSGPATDTDLEEGTFQVLAEIGGEPAWIVADVTPPDIALQEVGDP